MTGIIFLAIGIFAGCSFALSYLLRQREANATRIFSLGLALPLLMVIDKARKLSVASFTPVHTFSTGVLGVAVWGYAYHSQSSTPDSDVDLERSETKEGQEEVPLDIHPNSIPNPTLPKLALAACGVLAATFLLSQSSNSYSGGNATFTLYSASGEQSFSRDVEQFFKPRGWTPADWSEVRTTNCVYDTFGNDIRRNSSYLAGEIYNFAGL